MSVALEDDAVVGDAATVALVSRWGSKDRLCLPRFEVPACFASLLGDGSHGARQLAPAGTPRAISRRYHPGTLVPWVSRAGPHTLQAVAGPDAWEGVFTPREGDIETMLAFGSEGGPT